MIIQRKNCVSTLYFYQAKWSPASRAACSGYFKKKKKNTRKCEGRKGRSISDKAKQTVISEDITIFIFFWIFVFFVLSIIINDVG